MVAESPATDVALEAREFCGATCPLVIVGAWQLSSGHSSRSDSQEVSKSVAALKAHADVGLVCFDCADIYTGVEHVLGELATGSCSKEKIRVHTKCVPDLDAMDSNSVNRTYLEAGILRSLNRLKQQSLDLVQFHWWDYSVAGFEGAYGQLCTLKRDGLVQMVGLTNTDLPHLRELVSAGHPVASNQVQFSLLDRRPMTSGMTAFCQENGIELLCYGSLAGGFLTNKWLGKEDPGFSNLENRSLTKYRLVVDEYGSWDDFQRLLGLLNDIAMRRGADIAAVASGWVLRHKLTRVILGARSAEHAPKMAASLNLALAPEDLKALDAEVAGRGITGEVFGAERSGGRHTGIMRRNLNGIGTEAHLGECLARVQGNRAQGNVPHLRRELELLKELGCNATQIEESLAVVSDDSPVEKKARLNA